MAASIHQDFSTTLLRELIEMWVVWKDSHLWFLSNNIVQVVHVIGLKYFLLRCNFFCSRAQKCCQVNLSIITLQKSLIESELGAIDFLQHLFDFLCLASERFRNIDSKLLLEIYVHNHPICLSTCLNIAWIKGSNSDEFKHMILVDVLTHVAHNMFL